MKLISLDPRVTRFELEANEEMPDKSIEANALWETFQVFHQKKRGNQHSHVGIVHAPNADLALLFAKEQYARRGQTVNIWVVKTADVVSTDYEDTDIFESTMEKRYREAGGYKVGDRIKAYKEKMKQEQA